MSSHNECLQRQTSYPDRTARNINTLAHPARSDSLVGQPFLTPLPPIPPSQHLYFAPSAGIQDVRYRPDAGCSMNHSSSNDSVSTGSGSSSSYLPFSNLFTPSSNSHGAYSATAPSHYPLTTYSTTQSMPDIRPRVPSLHMNSMMAPPARSPAVSNSQSPSIVPSARENYMTSTPHLNRHVPRASPGEAISITQRPPLPANARPYDANSAPPTPSNGKLEPANQLTINDNDGGPPLDRTVLLHQITAPDGQSIEPKINARIDKGFFRADQDWTCYRRNYFAVACSYSLEPPINNFPLTLHRSGSGMSENIFGFAMSISAVVDGANGKAIELIQHTPKRDKGPQGKPDRIKLNPHIPGSVGITPGLGLMANASQAPGQQEYEQAYYPQSSHTLTIANFDRIQFKSATANNGKRRAAQQYYHLIVELFADLGGPAVNPEARWVKVASRMSVPMVVRGRSPGHYQDEKRSSSSSAGPGSGPGSDGRRIVGPRLSTPNGTHISLLNGSPMLGGGGGYQPSGGLASHQHSPAGSSMGGTSLSSTSSTTGQIDNPVEPIISTEEAEAIEGYSAYQYYPSALYDSQLSHSRPAYHSTSYRDERTTGPPYAPFEGENIRAFSGGEIRRLSKDDYTPQHPGLPLSNQWNPTGPASKDVGRGEILSRSCGRFEGAESSRGHFPDLSPVNY